MAIPAVEQTIRELEERVGPIYDLLALARFCQVSRRELRLALERAGVPVIDVGQKQLVQRELAEKALGLDFAELLADIHRNEVWMRRRELHADGRRKSVGDYADEMSAMAQQASRALIDGDER